MCVAIFGEDMKIFCIITCLLLFTLSQQIGQAQQPTATEPTEESAEGFIELGMPLEEALTKITFSVEWLSSDGSDEVVFEGEGVTREEDYIELKTYRDAWSLEGVPYRRLDSLYILLSKYAAESNRYIFVPLAQSGGGSGVFWDLNVVDKKTLRTVGEVGLGDRARVESVIVADPASDTVSITYIRREVNKGKVSHDPNKAIKQHFRMIEGKLRKVENPLKPLPLDMMFIPAGNFDMGSRSNANDAEDDEKPRHTVYVDAFYIDRYEVTNAQYKKFVDANRQWQKDRIPEKYHDGDYLKHWDGNDYPPNKGNHPVVYVSWYAAMAYAQWQGKRLPTEAEWEKAARGNRFGREYAWGDSLDFNKANYGEYIGDTTPVGTYDMNGYGLYDMTGNVWEWCLDEYEADFYAISPSRNPLAGGTVTNWTDVRSVRVLRGGSWASNAKFVRVSDRTRFTPRITNKARGFRCVKPVTPSAEGFIELGMPLEEALTKITFIVTWSSGEGNSEVIFEGEGVTHYPDRIVLRKKHEIYGRTSYSSYTILPQDTVESNRYIFVPLADWGGGSGVFFDLNVVDKKTLKSVDEVSLGDRTNIKEVALVDAHSDTVSITYIRREVKKGEPLHDPKKAIKKHFRMIGGILQEVENLLIPSEPDIVLPQDPKMAVPDRTQILLSPSDPNMVLIPAGEFQMGSTDKAFDDEKWIHTVYIDAFYIDIYEITNAQYKMFVDANPQWQKDYIPWKYHDGNYLKDWDGNNYPIGKGDHPVANVSWHGARAYAKWVDKRLPTEAEWEKAARGGLTGQRYPWGNSIDFSNANHARNVGGTTPVGSYPPNRYGLYDMVGNVWEWCLDEHNRDFYKTSPGRNPIAGTASVTDIINGFFNRKSWRVLRGGSWIRFARDVKISDIDYGPPNFSNDDFGFRCVKDVTPDLKKHGDLSPLRTPPIQK